MTAVRGGTAPGTVDERRGYATDTAALLWPGATITVDPAGAPATGDVEFLLLPSAARPRLLAPVTDRRAAAAAVRGSAAATGRERHRARLLAVGLRTGLAQPLLRGRLRVRPAAPGLLDRLSSALATPLTAGLYLSAPRANRKPVLQLIDPAGRTVGYAKVAVDPLTASLVRTETAALRRLAAGPLPGLRTARVLHEDDWQGHPVLVQEPLPTTAGGPGPGPERLATAVRVIAGLDRCPAAPLVGTAYWKRLSARVGRLPDGPAAAGLHAVLAALAERCGPHRVPTGAWHGDLTPWNLAVVGSDLVVWDWERFETGVPVGFDALHHRLQADLVTRRVDPTTAVVDLCGASGSLLAAYDVDPVGAEVAVLCYLTDLATRYTADRQDDAGARLGRVQDWLLPTLRARLERCPR